jgi:hypothetical protein
MRCRRSARSLTPAVSSGASAEGRAGAPVSGGPSKGDPGLGLIAGAAQLVELPLQRADLCGVDERLEAERWRFAQLLNPPLELLDRRAGQIELIAQRTKVLLLGRIEQALPRDAGLAGDIGQPARQIGDHWRRLERRPGQVRRDHLGEGVELGPRTFGIAHQMLVQDNPEVTSSLTHLLERIAAAAEQVDQRDALGIEQLEDEPHALGRILDAGEGVGHICEQVLARAQVAALVA